MRTVIALVTAVSMLGAATTPASAQSRFDVGLLLGSTRATNEGTVLQFDRGTTYQATVAWPVWRSAAANLSIEVPFIASPAFTVLTAGGSLPLEYASLYLTPGARITVTPRRTISYFGAVGAGYARYSESKLTADRQPNPAQRDTNTGAVEFGGGADIRVLSWFAFRGELRDVYTGARNFSIDGPRPPVHNVIVSGGLVFRF